MTSLHKARLAAWILAVATVLAAFRGWSDEDPGLRPAAEGTAGSGVPTDADLRAGEFRRRNPFSFVRVHPPPAPPAVTTNVATAKPPPPKPSKVELPLKLRGTVAAGRQGMAFLHAASPPGEHVLGVGADLGDSIGKGFAGVVLAEVGRNRAVFRRDQEEWVLEVDLESAATPARPVPAPAPSTPVPPPPVAETREEVPPGSPVTIERVEIERATRNLAYLVTQLSVQPYFESGKPAGVRVSRIRPESLFSRLGLKNGDVLKGVGDQEVTSLRETVKVLQAFQRNESVGVKVLRSGRLQTLDYQIR